MKFLIFLFLLIIFLPLGAQLRTQLRPAYPAVRRVAQKAWGVRAGRRVFFVGYMEAQV